MQYTLVFGLIFALIVGLFAVSNYNVVTVKFPWGSYDVSQAIIILGSAAFGAIAVTLLGLIRQFKLILRQWEADKKIKKLEKQIISLENQINTTKEYNDKMADDIERYKSRLIKEEIEID